MGGDSDLIAASAKLLGETNLTYLDITKPKQDETDDEESVTRKMEDYKKERLRVQSSVQWTLHLPAGGALRGVRHPPLADARRRTRAHLPRLTLR